MIFSIDSLHLSNPMSPVDRAFPNTLLAEKRVQIPDPLRAK